MKLIYLLLSLLYGVQVSLAVNHADLARQIERNVPELLELHTNVINYLVTSKQSELTDKAMKIISSFMRLSRRSHCPSPHTKQISLIIRSQIRFRYSLRDCVNSDGLKAAGKIVKYLVPIKQRIAELIRDCNPYTEICSAKFEDIDRELNLMYNGFIQRVGSIFKYAEICIKESGNSIERSLNHVYNMWQECEATNLITTTAKPVLT